MLRVRILFDTEPLGPEATADTYSFSPAQTRDAPGLSIAALKVGALVNVKVEKVVPNGVFVSFLDVFTGSVDEFHVPPERKLAKGLRVCFSP